MAAGPAAILHLIHSFVLEIAPQHGAEVVYLTYDLSLGGRDRTQEGVESLELLTEGIHELELGYGVVAERFLERVHLIRNVRSSPKAHR